MRRPRIIGWCAYCHSPIYSDEEYAIEGSEIFHPECLEQKNTYYDPYGDDELNDEEE